jgi:predicted AlkP superfamily pyrophosphatase or phosphodiesterase
MRGRKFMKSKKRIIIISLDAVGTQDMEYMKGLKYFGEFAQDAAICEHVNTVYPSLTYPAHTSIMTGKWPKNHGVINNVLIQPQREKPDWMWQRKYVKGTTLYDEALKAGMKVASIFWPVTARSKITYNMPEVLANRPWQNQITASLSNGSLIFQFKMLQKYGHLVHGVSQPALDNFSLNVLLETLRQYRPEMTLVHFTDADSMRHENGVSNENVKRALQRHDARLGEIFRTLKELGLYEETTIIILGDHYQLDCDKVVYFNYEFKQRGYLKVSEKTGKIIDYKAFANNCDGSCYIYVKDKTIEKEIGDLLKSFADDSEGKYGIERIFTGEEAGILGADPTCSYMVEAKPGYYYLNGFEKMTERVNDVEKHKMYATHGYLPTKQNYQTFFMAKGPGIKNGISIAEMSLPDEGATLAALLGFDLGETDGKVIHEILK